MKSFKLICSFLLLAIISTSCFDEWFGHEPKVYRTHLALSIRDTLDNDLISGIACTYFPSFGDSYCEITDIDVFRLNRGYSVSIQKYGDYYHVKLDIDVDKKRETFPDRVTFSLRSPYVFGDNYSHDVVTYWKPTGKGKWDYVCSRVEYGGKEFSVENKYFAKIVLDR